MGQTQRLGSETPLCCFGPGGSLLLVNRNPVPFATLMERCGDIADPALVVRARNKSKSQALPQLPQVGGLAFGSRFHPPPAPPSTARSTWRSMMVGRSSWCWRALAKLHSVGGLMLKIHSFRLEAVWLIATSFTTPTATTTEHLGRVRLADRQPTNHPDNRPVGGVHHLGAGGAGSRHKEPGDFLVAGDNR